MVERIYHPLIHIELRHGEVLGNAMLQYTHHKRGRRHVVQDLECRV